MAGLAYLYNSVLEPIPHIGEGGLLNHRSTQLDNLMMLYPLMKANGDTQGTFYDSSYSFTRGWLFNANGNFAYGRHPNFGFYVPVFPGSGAGNSATCIAIGRVGGSAAESNYSSNGRAFPNRSQMSFSCWFRPRVVPGSAVTSIFTNPLATNPDPPFNWSFRFHATGSGARLIYGISTGASGSENGVANGFGSILADTDYFALFTFDGLNQIAYLNGEFLTSTTMSGGLGNAASSMYIGGNPQQLFASETFDGMVWDVRLYNAVLRPQQVRDMYQHPLELWEFPRNRRTVAPSPNVVNNQSLSHDVTVAQVIGSTKVCTRALSNTVTVSHRVNTQYFHSVSHTATVGDDIEEMKGTIFHVSVEHFVAVDHVIRSNREVHVSVVHTVTVAQVAGNLSTHVIHTVTVSHEIKIWREINVRVVHSVVATDAIWVQSPQIAFVFHNLSVSHAISGRNAVNRQSITHTVFVVDQIAGRNGVIHASVTHEVIVSQIVMRRDVEVFQAVTHGLTVTHRVNTQYFHHVVHDANPGQVISAHREVIRNIVTDIGITSTFGKQRLADRSIISSLVVANVFDRSITYNRTITDTQEVINLFTPIVIIHRPTSNPPLFPPGYTEPTPIVRLFPTGLQIIYDDVCILQGTTTLVLPVPELADTNSLTDSLRINRSVTGKTSTYVRTNPNETFGLEFIVDLKKYTEVRDWVFLNNTQTLRFTMWNGEIWSVHLLTDSIEFTGVRRTNIASRELYKVKLEFEGIRIFG